jgi:Protein of unknown function (DUF4231)
MPEENAASPATVPVPHPNSDPNSDPIFGRLEDQISWYGRKSRSAQRTFKRIKVVEILAAAAIPFLAGLTFRYDRLVTAGLGVLITILEGVLHLNQYQQNWTNYRSTCEALKHEKFVYLGNAGPYATAPNPHALLAERVESTVSQEHAQWASIQQQAAQQQAPKTQGTAARAAT